MGRFIESAKIRLHSELLKLGQEIRNSLRKIPEDGVYPETFIAELDANSKLAKEFSEAKARIRRARKVGLASGSFKEYKNNL